MNRVYIGYDEREPEAARACVRTLCRRASQPVLPLLLDDSRLRAAGLITRPVDTRGRFDLISGAPYSTQFANSRFVVPILAQSGWVLFVDCDVLFLCDVNELFLSHADPRYAVQVVKHQLEATEGFKMDGAVQTAYARKNWSSVILWNCDHPANRRLTLHDVNNRPGRDLHAFYWLADSEIGTLPPEFNWLVGVQPKPANPKIAHFTLGGPFTPGWAGAEHDDLWITEQSL